MKVREVILQTDDNLKIQVRRNQSIQVNCAMVEDHGLTALLADIENKKTTEQKEAEKRHHLAMRQLEEDLWRQVEEMPEPPRDPLGNPVTRETHRIQWDYTFTGQYDQNGLEHIYIYPYIEPIKSEYDK